MSRNDLTAEKLDELLALAEKSRPLSVIKEGKETIYIHGRDNDSFPMHLWITVEGSARCEVSNFIAACDPDTIRQLIAMARRPMSPKEFAERMRAAITGDEEVQHSTADGLMTTLLCGLGYGEGVEVFEKMDKWYA